MKKTKTYDAETTERRAKIIEEFKDKRGRYEDFWEPIYEECEKHRTFTLMGKQFDKGEASKYGLTKPLEPNLLLTYANHEANKTLQTDYRGKVTPNGGGANDIKARERQDVLRGLQRVNNIERIFNMVRRDQVCGGIAYSISKVDYAGKRGYGKTLKDEFVKDYRKVFPDITVDDCTFSDMKDCLIKQDVSKAEWFEVTGRKASDENWSGSKTKEVWHYWVREDIQDEELLKEDNSTVMRSEMEDGDKEEPDWTGMQLDENGEPLSRPTTDYSWCWYKIYEEEILDDEQWLGSYPPVIACTGRKVIDKEGNVHYQPLTQFAEEPQKVYTIIENIIALRLSRSPFSKWKIAADGIDIKQMIAMRAASIIGDMDIVYKHADAQGNAIPPPEEIEPHVLDAILITLQNEQRMKIQQIFGIFDANLGNRSNEQSGVAIRERAQGGELSNYDIQFNFMEYVKQVNRGKLDLIPKYLTAPQQLAFVDLDDNAVVRWVNTTGGVQFSPDEEYSLSIEATPISQTAREDEAQALMDMAKVIPQMTQNPKVASLIARAQPGRYSAQIADILAGDDPQMKQAQQQLQEMQGKLQQAQAKQQQDALNMTALKASMTGIKQQMAAMKTLTSIKDATAEAQAQHAESQRMLDDMTGQVDAMDKALDRQVEQYKAENGRISAEAAMLKVVGDLAKPEPVTPAPGQGLP